MYSKHVKLACFLLLLPSFHGSPNGQRPIDANLRGNSFGLENFLFQSYNTGEVAKPKRIRPAANPRWTTNDRGQTYGMENFNAQLYESNRLRAPAAKPQNNAKRKPIEPTAESNRVRENFVMKPETVPETTKEPETTSPTPERIRKRIMMRRRRKRPSHSIQSENNSEITGNAIFKPERIPIYPQFPKAVITTKLSDDRVKNRKPVDEKILPVYTEKIIPEETTEHEETTLVMNEKPTILPRVTTTSEKPSTINLKTFLKQQTETLSLSELLQTQNLSLADLLRGNKDASAILKARKSTSTTEAMVTVNRRKTFNREDVDKTQQPSKKIEVAEVTTSRSNYNGFQPKIPRTKTSEQTSNKPVDENQDEITKQVKRPIFVSAPIGLDPSDRLNELRSKLRNFQKKTSTPVTQPPTTSASPSRDETIEPASSVSKTTELPPYKKNRVSFKSANNPELSLILPSKIKPDLENSKRPERLTNWTSRLPPIKRLGQDGVKPPSETLTKPLKVPILIEDDIKSLEEEPQTTPKPDNVAEEDFKKPEPKDELIELLKSGQNAERLQKILNSRNMTIQELLDNREKPPLQTNISTLFKPIPTTPKPTLFDSLPDFQIEDMDAIDSEYDEPEAEESAPSTARVLIMPSREPKHYEFPVSEKGVSQLNLQPDDPSANTANDENSALWKLSEKVIYYGSSYGYGNFPAVQQTEKPIPELTNSDVILLETIRKSPEKNRKFKLDLSGFVREEEPQTEDIEKSYIPPAVKSAIIASGVVMGIALFVFIAIFAACGWKQRQIRLKSSSSTFGGTLSKKEKSERTISPVSFKDAHSYRKSIDFDDETSESGTSNTSSYLWNTLKNTFTSRASTLKSRLEKEEKLREDKVTLRRNESRRKDEGCTAKKIDRDRNVINTSFNFKRSPSNNNVSHFNECVHGY